MRRSGIVRNGLFTLAVLLQIVLTSCRPGPIQISPLPNLIESMEGHASLRLTGTGASERSKFSFALRLPGRAKIEVSDFLGRTLYQILIDGPEAYLVLASKRVYWQGAEEEILEKFLGFPLRLDEMVSLFSGRWEASARGQDGPWILTRDSRGRIRSGQRDELTFEIEEFIEDTSFTRTLSFGHLSLQGRLKILSLKLNEPTPKAAFAKDFLTRFERKSWPEIQDLFDGQN